MNKKLLLVLWGILFVLCAGLGFISEPEGTVKYLMTALSLLFFVPGGLLLWNARKDRDKATLKLIRSLSACSLGLTLVMLIANFLSVLGSTALGDGLYTVLIVVSSPMVCSGNWLVSLFLWACLLIISIDTLKKTKTGR